MKQILVLVAALGLASCDADQASRTLGGEADKAAAARTATPKPTRLATPETAGSPDAIAVVTTKSVPEYYKDLEHCRAVAAARMGPPDAQDDLDALKRALMAHPGEKTISPIYINTDRAIQRREVVKWCLSTMGYLVK